jgi:hypothetical protein
MKDEAYANLDSDTILSMKQSIWMILQKN